MTWLRKPQVWIGVGLSALCLWLAVRSVPFDQLTVALAGADMFWLAPALAFQLLAVLARAQRWVDILETRGHLQDSFWAQGIGFLFTNVLPLRLGEPARVLVMAERTGRPIAHVAATAIVERLLDVAAMVLLLLFILPGLNVPPLVLQSGLTLGGVAFTVLLIGVPLAVKMREPVFSWLHKRAPDFPRIPVRTIAESWIHVVSGLEPLTQIKRLAPILGWTVIAWALSVGMYWCGILAFRPSGSWVEASFMIATLSFSVSIPSSPGFVGIYQLAGQQALVLPFGDRYSSAIAFAITMTTYVTYLLTTSALGVLGLWRLGTSFAVLGQRVGAFVRARG